MKFDYLQILVAVFLFGTTCWAKSESEPHHPHEGKVKPFQPGDPQVPLSKEALEILKSGKPYKTQIQSGASGRGLVVQDVHAPSDIVWERILDFDHYAEMVPKTIRSSNYRVLNDDKYQTIYTQMQVGFPMIKLQFFIRHEYYPVLNSLTWTLDYTRKSDLDDSCGYWYVIPHPDHYKEWSRVFYSVDVSMFDWVPTFVVNFMANKALTEATGWVKKYSELEFSKRPSSSVSGEEDHAIEKKKQKSRLPKWFGGRKSSKDSEIQDGETCSSTTDSTCDDSNNEEKPTETIITAKKDKPIGMARYALVASIVGLGMYNIHLYFSQ